MARIEVTMAIYNSSRSMYYNLQCTWGLPNEVDEFTSEKVVETLHQNVSFATANYDCFKS